MVKLFSTYNKLPTQLTDLTVVLKQINNSRKYKFALTNNKLHSTILAGKGNVETIYCDISLNNNQLVLQTGLTYNFRVLFIIIPLALTLVFVMLCLNGHYSNYLAMAIVLYLLAYLILLLVVIIKNYDIKQELKKYGVIN